MSDLGVHFGKSYMRHFLPNNPYGLKIAAPMLLSNILKWELGQGPLGAASMMGINLPQRK